MPGDRRQPARAFEALLRRLSVAPDGAVRVFGRLAAVHGNAGLAGADAADETTSRPVAKVSEVLERRTNVLFDYQEEIIERLNPLIQRGGSTSCLVSLPTGAGKTRLGATACLRLLKSSIQSVVWVAPTLELVDQAIAAFRVVHASGEGPPCVRLEQLGTAAVDGPVVYFGTTQLLAARSKSVGEMRGIPTCALVVFDEAHVALAPSYKRALDALRRREDAPSIVGLTATPGRSSELGSDQLAEVFRGRWVLSRILGASPVDVLRQRGVLSNVEFRLVPFDGAGRGTRLSRRFREAMSVDDLALHQGRFASTVQLCATASEEGRTLVFCGSLLHAAAVCSELRQRGVRAAMVSGYQAALRRRRVLSDFEGGRTTVLLNMGVLIAGYDVPAIRNVLISWPVRSVITFEQMVGRASRGPLVGGHERNAVYMFDDLLALHGRPSSYARFKDFAWADGR